MPDGVVIEGVDGKLEQRDRGWGGGDTQHGFRVQCLDNGVSEARLTFCGVDGTLEEVGGGSSGGGEHEQWLEYRDTGIGALRVSYGEPGAPAATETIDLRTHVGARCAPAVFEVTR